MIGKYKKFENNYFSNDSYIRIYQTPKSYFEILTDDDLLEIDGVVMSAKDLRTEKNSKFSYNWYTMQLIEYTQNEIINILEFVEIL